MNNLTFNPVNHEYRLDGVVIPSVTQILKAEGLTDFSMVPEAILEANSRFGKALHACVDYRIKGTLKESSVDPALKPHLSGWDNFVEDFGFKVKRSEVQGVHPLYRYAFTTDLLGEITNGNFLGDAVGDIKTGMIKPADKIQIAAYKMAVGKQYKNTFLLYLNPDYRPRGYKVIFATNNKMEQGLFLSALSIHNWKKQEKLI